MGKIKSIVVDNMAYTRNEHENKKQCNVGMVCDLELNHNVVIRK